MSFCRALVPYEDPRQALLTAYMLHCRRRCYEARRVHRVHLEQFNKVLWECCIPFEALNKRIHDLRRRIAAMSRGVPLTEILDDDIPSDRLDADEPEEVRKANQLVLRKAWRYVAQRLHTDRAGGSKEDFQALKNAFRSGDIRPLNEFILSLNGTLEDQIRFWLIEVHRSDMEWQVLRKMRQYRIVHAKMQGQDELAAGLAEAMLEERAWALERELLAM